MVNRMKKPGIPGEAPRAVPSVPVNVLPEVLFAEILRIPPGGPADLAAGEDVWTVLWTLRGSGRLSKPDGNVEAAPGSLVFLEPRFARPAFAAPGEAWECFRVAFIPRPGWRRLLTGIPVLAEGIREASIPDKGERKRMELAFRYCLEDALASDGILSRDLAMNSLGEIVNVSARSLSRRSALHPFSEPIRRVTEYVQARYSKPLRVSALARIAGLSSSHLSHRFREETGESVVGYVIRQRLLKAANLLENADWSVKQVAFAVGFRSAAYLSRLFQRQFRTSPRAYRVARRG